jgi:hypothetical protein
MRRRGQQAGAQRDAETHLLHCFHGAHFAPER